jgi:type IV pilus assembly protein PilV
MSPRHRTARGFTLIEMLIALVVLSIGLLGAAKLFIVTLQGNASATSRMLAVNLVGDLADKIRANRLGGAAYAGAAASNNCAGGAIGAVTCTAAQMAADDLFQWNAQIANAWPGGAATGAVAYVAPVSATLPATYRVTINWQEQGTGQMLTHTLTVQI